MTLVDKKTDHFLTRWEQQIPFPFSNVFYDLLYKVDSSQENIQFFRYQLQTVSSALKVSDGLIVIEKITSKRTRYTEYSFFNADWGVLLSSIFTKHKIWSKSLESILISDFAIKTKAEHPDWNYKKIRQFSEQETNHYPIDTIVQKRILFDQKSVF